MKLSPEISLSLAEQLSTSAIVTANHSLHYTDEASRQYQGAWIGLESALATNDLDLLERSRSSFQTISETTSNEKYRHGAGTVLDLSPAYEFRCAQEPYPSEIIQLACANLGRRALEYAYNERTNDFGMCYQSILFALCASEGNPNYLLFAGSPREASYSYKAAGLNHDGYVVRDQKIPIEAKADSRNRRQPRDPRIHRINVRPSLVIPALRVYGREYWRPTQKSKGKLVLSPDRMRELCQLTGEVIVANAEHKTLSPDNAAYLDGVQAKIREFIDDFHQQQLEYQADSPLDSVQAS